MKNPATVVATVVDGIQHHSSYTSSQHQQHQQQPTVTTTAAQAVITVVAPSPATQQQQSTEMISTQPVTVVQMSTGGANHQYIVSGAENNVHEPETTADPTSGAAQSAYEDYAAIYSNGSGQTGSMTYFVTEQYPSTYYGQPLSEAHVVYMDQSAATADQINQQQQQQQAPPQPQHPPQQPPTLTNNNELLTSHRDTGRNIMNDDYNKSYQPTRMSVQPQTVSWLEENYETADGVSLPRSTLYSHYQQHCQQNSIEPVNAASFGKLIRSVFVGLRTRRLGTRGNSKYHYYGIKVKASSALNNSNNGTVESNTMPPVKRSKVNHMSNNKNNNVNDIHHAGVPTKESLQSYLGNSQDLLDKVWPETIDQVNQDSQDDLQKLFNLFIPNYRAHYVKIIQALSELNFQEVENIWMSFWQPNVADNNPEKMNIQCLKGLTKTNLANWILQTDYTMYNSIISNLLLPDLLKPIPQPLTQQIRNFAKCIIKWMSNALIGYPDEFIQMKTSAVSALSHMLRRYTSLNHLSTAACAVLKNHQQVVQMINDLSKVDFRNVQEQASWVCQCDEKIVHQVENSFKEFLQETNPYERWADWCGQVLNMSLPNHNSAAAKQFFFKWEFYSSLVMRDLTLRSAQSFGSFHLIRLLFDEYIFYLVEQKIAKTTGITPLQMLGKLASSASATATSSNSNNNNNSSQHQPVASSTAAITTITCPITSAAIPNHPPQTDMQQQPPPPITATSTNATAIITTTTTNTNDQQQQQLPLTTTAGTNLPGPSTAPSNNSSAQ